MVGASGKSTGCKLISKKNLKWVFFQVELYIDIALKIIENKNVYNPGFINRLAKSIKLKNLKGKKLFRPDVTKLSSIIAKKNI